MFPDRYLLQAQELSNGNIGRRATTRLANRILREYKKQYQVKKPPYDPQLVAQYFGINVETTDSLSLSSGKFLSKGDQTSILLKKKDTYYRRRFTCAHELGHAILRGYSKSRVQLPLLNPEYKIEEEVRANIFAGDFLMPEKDLIETIKKQDPANDAENVAITLARTFAVHLFAIVNRLSDFELPVRNWLFLIFKYMAHPARAKLNYEGPQPKLRVLRSATHGIIYVPRNQGADSIGLSISNLTLEQVQNFNRYKSTEKVLIKMIDQEGKWRNAEAFCHARYRGASSPIIGPSILGFLTVKDIKLLP